ncbi:MAG: hypothetical protein VR65_16250 [Desulfobulbaceae bacterium BRH_c16a]|nr:MAG: hypothetical protein VR65_16250 [Desulfobulbaceae bacterium BRH_c16a]
MIRQRILTALLIVSIFSALSSCSTPEENKEKHYLRAIEYIKIADEKAAILELKNAIQLDAKYADARYQLGMLYLKNGDPNAAFGELQRAFSLDPQNSDAGVKVAEFYLLSQKKEDSRRLAEQVLNANPDYPDGLALLANIEILEGNMVKAEEIIGRAIKLSPANDKFYSIKGRILSSQNKEEEGEEAFNKAIELNPESFAHYRTLLIHYENRKDEAATQKLLDQMTTKFPDDPQLQLLIAGLCQKKNELDKAEQALLKAIEMKKDAISYRLMLVDFYKNQRQYDKAEEYLKNALADLPEDIQLQVVLADLLFDLQKFPESREMMETILKSNPANGAANLINARFLIKDGKDGEALDIITPLTIDYPQWADPFYYSALTYLRTGQMELAQKAIEMALQINPVNDRYHTLAAQIYLLRGNGAEAGKEASIALKINRRNFIAAKILTQSLVLQKEYDKTIQLVGSIDKKIAWNDVELLGAVGMAYIGLNIKDKATETFGRLLELAPENTKALSILAVLTSENDLDKAVAYVKTHLSQHETGNHYMFLGELYAKKQQNEEALRAFEKAQELNPADPRGYILRARLLRLLGKSEESITQYNELLATQPDSIAALMGLAAAYESEGRADEAMGIYKRILEIKPDFPAAANNLSWLIASEEKGDLGEALRLAMQAKQALPKHPNIADTLGWVHYKRESYGLAISQFRHALENLPDDPTITFHLALAQYANGEKTEATALLKEVVAGENQFSEKDEAQAILQKWQNQ